MFSLIQCEWLRMRKMMALAFLLHCILLIVLAFFGLFNSDAVGFKMMVILFYGLCGFLFGLVQMKSYTKSSRWTYFINRPIHPQQVYIALVVATFLGFIGTLLVPVLLTTVVIDMAQIQIIDYRHYVQLLYTLGMTLCFYLLATYLSLSQTKTSLLLLMIIILPIISLNLAGSVLWLLFSVVVLLLLLNISIVKVNLDGVSNSRFLSVTTALCFQYALYFIIVSMFFLINEIKLDIEYRNNDKKLGNVEKNSNQFRDLIFLSKQDLMLAALSDSKKRHKELIEEVKLNETLRIRKRVWFHPTHQQIQFMDENNLSIEDEENQRIWTFSHDLMLFIGKDQNNGQVKAYLGPNGSSKTSDRIIPFSEVPWIEGDQFISGNLIYRYLSDSQSVELLFSVDESERLLNVLQHQGSIKSVITTKHLYIIDSNDFDLERFPLKAKLKMALPGDYNNLWDVNVTEVRDRFILTFLYGKSERHEVYPAEQLTYEFDLTGRTKLINQRTLEHSPPYIIKNLDFVLSPAWKTLLDYFPIHPSSDRYLKKRPQLKSYSKNTLLVAGFMALFYMLMSYVIAKNKNVTGRKAGLWIVFNAVLGLPGVLSFLIRRAASSGFSTLSSLPSRA